MVAKSELVRKHSDDERKPCGSCRLKLILAGVEPARIDQIKSFDETKEVLKKAISESVNDPNIVASAKAINREDEKCKGICHNFEPQWVKEGRVQGGRSTYELDAKCNVCSAWINKAKLRSAYEHYDPILQGFNPYGSPGKIKCPCCHRQLKQRSHFK